MKPISRGGKSLAGKGNRYASSDASKDIIAQKMIKQAENEGLMSEAFKIGLSEFLDETTTTLGDVPQLDKIIYLNRQRKNILEALFYKAYQTKSGTQNNFFELKMFTDEEIEFVLFHLDKLHSFTTWEAVKEFIHKNFQDIRSAEDLKKLIDGEEKNA